MIKRTESATGNYREMSYDFRNRLVMVTERNSANVAMQVSTYTYDCFDKRISKRISKQVDTTPGDNVETPKQWFAYDGVNVRLEFIDTEGSGAQPALMTTRYFNGAGIDNIIAQAFRLVFHSHKTIRFPNELFVFMRCLSIAAFVQPGLTRSKCTKKRK